MTALVVLLSSLLSRGDLRRRNGGDNGPDDDGDGFDELDDLYDPKALDGLTAEDAGEGCWSL